MPKSLRETISKGMRRSKNRDQTNPSILDPQLEQNIQEILQLCHTHMASVSIRSVGRKDNAIQAEHQLRTVVKSLGDVDKYIVSSDRQAKFHIASITKILVAIALIIAVEVKAKDDVADNPYAKFKGVQNEPLTRLYNQNKNERQVNTGGLRGDPTLYNLLVHSKGLRSLNHRLLAPSGEPLLTSSQIPDELIRPLTHSDAVIDTNESWTKYSNTNYAAIAMTIEALWDGSLESFMKKTLFEPLHMDSTSIGLPANTDDESEAWVVDCDLRLHKIVRPKYEATGAEAGCFGGYSTAQDLDTFFSFLLESFHGREIIPGFDLDVLGIVLSMENEYTELLHYTPLGLLANLDSSIIGSMSSNRLQFPDEKFSRYHVLDGKPKSEISIFYMAGAALGCGCATAFYLSVNKESFAVVVLTDTSGPVDSADHILRLILRRICQLKYSNISPKMLSRAENIKGMVSLAATQSSRNWKRIQQSDDEYKNKPPPVDQNIVGIYNGDGFSQTLDIYKGDDGKLYVRVGYTTTSHTSQPLQVIWIDNTTIKLCILPHLSIDVLGDGDWSNLKFTVEAKDQVIQKLKRKVGNTEDHFVRLHSQSSTGI